jgi:MoaA/NifB/PqqE/SkfB family radical SAM enzyme
MAVGVYTNGLRREPLLEAAPHLSWVYVSLDEATPQQYKQSKGVNAYFPVIGTIQSLAGKTVVGVGFLLHGGNYHQAPKMAAIAKDLGADYVQFRPVVGLGDYEWLVPCLDILRAIDDPFVYVSFRRFEDLLHSHQGCYERQYGVCRASELTPCIGADGTLWVCPNTRGIRALGNLREESFEEIWARRETQFVGDDCRIACRNDAGNETLEYVCSVAPHMEFV